MDQMHRSNDAYNSLFADSNQQYHAYDSNFLSGNDPNFNDASWGLNASGYNPNTSRAQPLVSSWQNANHLSTSSAQGNGQASQFARSLSQSPAPFGQASFAGYQPQQTYQYGQQPQYDPQLFNSSAAGQSFNNNFSNFSNAGQTLGTIAPHALQQQVRSPAPNTNQYGVNYTQNAFGQQRFTSAPTIKPVDQNALESTIPEGADNGFYSTIGFDQLSRATNSERMAPYLNIGREVHEWPVNRTTTLPAYVPRKSKNELRKLVGNDPALLAKIGKKSIKKERSLSSVKPILESDLADSPTERIKYEGDTSSSEESDDDDDSSYTSDEDMNMEGSPLPNKRPDTPKDGVEYDTIKALWRPKRKSLQSEDIRKAVTDFWEITKTIRDRWKTDSAAVTQAEEKKRIGELPLLRSRVKDQRDMMEAATKAALKYGHRSILELMGGNASFVYLCYQFLLDRFKAEDLNSPLPRSMLELISIFTNLNNETLERTKLDKVLLRYAKQADAKTQHFAKRIISNAAVASKAKAATPPVDKIATTKTGAAASPPVKKSAPEPVAGIKRSASNAGEGAAQKKVATGNAKPNGTSTTSRPVAALKKASTTADSAKPAATAAPATKTKQVTAKPSSFFAGLQSAAKKPGTSIKTGTPAQASGTKPAEKNPSPAATATSAAPKSTFSFAATMASLAKPKEEKQVTTKQEKELPPETAEQKAKRLRKEARRKLHVSFKVGEDLVQVRYFTHEPEEELGHDDSQIRDVKDMGGEGRMLKMHADQMEIDEDDDAEDVQQPLADFKPPRPIDFSVIEEDERSRNYIKYGGKLEPDSVERAAREQYEANTLVVFYVDEKDVPANPREPSNPDNGQGSGSIKQFGAPDPKFALRAQQRKAMKPQSYQRPPALGPGALNNFMSNQPPAGQPAMLPPDLTQLLASLQPQPQQQQQIQAAPMMGFGGGAQAPAPAMMPQQAPQPNGQQIDLQAILAAIGGQQPQNAGQTPQMGGFGNVPGAPPMSFMPQIQQPDMSGQVDGGDDEKQGNKRWRDQGDKNKFYKTKVCRYWQEGRCMKGDGCTYLHEEAPSV